MTSQSDAERLAFEAWYVPIFDDQPIWDESRNCYVEHSIHMAWIGWQAARNPGAGLVPKNPQHIRAFIARNASAMRFKNAPENIDDFTGYMTCNASENDIYTVSAHDLLSSFEDWFATPDAPQPVSQAAQPADSLEVDAAWQFFCRTADYRRCLKWAQENEVPGALFVAFRSGLNVRAQAVQPAESLTLTDEQIAAGGAAWMTFDGVDPARVYWAMHNIKPKEA